MGICNAHKVILEVLLVILKPSYSKSTLYTGIMQF